MAAGAEATTAKAQHREIERNTGPPVKTGGSGAQGSTSWRYPSAVVVSQNYFGFAGDVQEHSSEDRARNGTDQLPVVNRYIA